VKCSAVNALRDIGAVKIRVPRWTHGDIDTVSDKIGVGEWRIRPAMVIKRAGESRPQNAVAYKVISTNSEEPP